MLRVPAATSPGEDSALNNVKNSMHKSIYLTDFESDAQTNKLRAVVPVDRRKRVLCAAIDAAGRSDHDGDRNPTLVFNPPVRGAEFRGRGSLSVRVVDEVQHQLEHAQQATGEAAAEHEPVVVQRRVHHPEEVVDGAHDHHVDRDVDARLVLEHELDALETRTVELHGEEDAHGADDQRGAVARLVRDAVERQEEVGRHDRERDHFEAQHAEHAPAVGRVAVVDRDEDRRCDHARHEVGEDREDVAAHVAVQHPSQRHTASAFIITLLSAIASARRDERTYVPRVGVAEHGDERHHGRDAHVLGLVDVEDGRRGAQDHHRGRALAHDAQREHERVAHGRSRCVEQSADASGRRSAVALTRRAQIAYCGTLNAAGVSRFPGYSSRLACESERDEGDGMKRRNG